MKYLNVLLLLVVSIFWTGCREKPVVPLPVVENPTQEVIYLPPENPLSASELVKKHPKLQKICDLAGGCNNVDITCTKYDGAGNSNLRNEVIWRVYAQGEVGMGFANLGKHPLDRAIRDWFDETEAKQQLHDEPPIIYPNRIPCDLSCAP